jgi:plasmid stability protein
MVPEQNHMNLSIKNVPEDLVERLRQRARRHHRSLQGELVAILETVLRPQPLTVDEAREQIASLRIKTEDSTDQIRKERDDR